MIIGITGRKRSGKDTIANYLCSNWKFTKYQMADPLKNALCTLYGWPRSWLEDGPEKEAIDPRYGISPRQAMQFMGAEYNKHLSIKYPEYGETTNTKLYLIRLEQFLKAVPFLHVVIPDVRMPFTTKAIQDMGGKVFKVERPSLDNNDSHDTEKFIDEMDVDNILVNDGSLEDLINLTESIIRPFTI